ncbi:MAG: PEP-CTERM sorting domain-containing protein [Crocosphaera sp.]|nr:PEP-CTERM sorting domain-containing protein [Crocosphaera sp.]
MKTKLISRITAGILGLASATSLGMVQEAQAGTVSAIVDFSVDDASLELNTADGTTSIIPLLFNTINGSALVGPFPGKSGTSDSDVYAGGPIQCPVDLENSASANISELGRTGSTDVGSGVNCLTNGGNTFAFATTILEGDNLSSNGIAAYNIFTEGFTVQAGDVLDLDGLFTLFLGAEITEFTPGEMKTASAEFLGTYEILFNGEPLIPGPPPIDFEVTLMNENGLETIFLELIDFDELPGGVDVIFPESGIAEIQFAVSSQVSASIMRTAPEPSAIISLTTVGIAALVSRNKRKNSAK